MKILLDSNYLLWSFIDSEKIRKLISDLLINEENQIFYSQASLWEISIKYNSGKLVLNGMKPEEFYSEIENSFLSCLHLNNDDLITFYKLPIEHKDPFHRIMIWQCVNSDSVFLSCDGQLKNYKKYGLKYLS